MFVLIHVYLWNSLHYLGCHVEFGRLFEMLLDLAQFGRADQRVPVLLGKRRRDDDLDIDLLYHPRCGVRMRALQDLDALCGEVALLTETQNIDARAGCEGREKQLEWSRRSLCGSLICGDRELAKVCIHAGAAGEVDANFHE